MGNLMPWHSPQSTLHCHAQRRNDRPRLSRRQTPAPKHPACLLFHVCRRAVVVIYSCWSTRTSWALRVGFADAPGNTTKLTANTNAISGIFILKWRLRRKQRLLCLEPQFETRVRWTLAAVPHQSEIMCPTALHVR